MERKNSVTLAFGATRQRGIVAGVAGLTLTVTLLASCGENATAPSATAPPVPPPPGSAATIRTFTNVAPIAIPDGAPNATEGTAAPYPSTIDVSGMPTGITNVKVGVSGLSHTAPEDVGLLLAGPQGHRVVLMSRAGCQHPIANVGLTFDDAARSGLPDLISTGSYRPSDYGPGGSFQGPAPPGPYGAKLDVFRGTDPNGEWRLYVLDRSGNNIGSIAGGWTIEITSGGPPSTVEASGGALSANRGSAIDSGCSSGH